jgi:hypothetical protein
VVRVTLLILSNQAPSGDQVGFALDVAGEGGTGAKIERLRDSPVTPLRHEDQLANPDSRVRPRQ